MENKYYFLFITVEGCGLCGFLKGNGIIGNGNHYMSFDVLQNILKDIPDCLFMNIHYNSFRSRREDIYEISNFYYKTEKDEQGKIIKESIFQRKFFKHEDKVKVLRLELEKDIELDQKRLDSLSEEEKEYIKEKVLDLNPWKDKDAKRLKVKTKQSRAKALETYTLTKNKEYLKWDDWITREIPLKLGNFTGSIAPVTLVVKGEDWKRGIEDDRYSFKVVTDKSVITQKIYYEWRIVNDRRVINSNQYPLKDMIKDVKKGELKIKEVKSEHEENKKNKYIYYDDPDL